MAILLAAGAILAVAVPVKATVEQNCTPTTNGVWHITGTVYCADRTITVTDVTYAKKGALTIKNVHLSLNPTSAEDFAFVEVQGSKLAPADASKFYAYDSWIDSNRPENAGIGSNPHAVVHIVRTKVEVGIINFGFGPNDGRVIQSHLIGTTVGHFVTATESNPFLLSDVLMEGVPYGSSAAPTRTAIYIQGDPTIEDVVIVGYGAALYYSIDSAKPILRDITISYCGIGIVKSSETPIEVHDLDILNSWNRWYTEAQYGPGVNASFYGDGSNIFWGSDPPYMPAGYTRDFKYDPWRTSPVHPERLPTLSVSGVPASTLTGTSLFMSASAGPSQTHPDPIADIIWYFGDGTQAHGTEVSHTYTEPGTYDVMVSVYDRKGLSNNVQRTIMVEQPNRPPVVTDLKIEPASPMPGQALRASATISDPDGDATSASWSWSENGVVQSDLTGVDAPGSRTQSGEVWAVSLTARDAEGAESLATYSVTIGNRAPSLSEVSLTPASPRRGDTLTATATASDPDGQTTTARWSWFLNDVLQPEYTTGSGPSDLVHGDEWRAVGTPNDGRSDGPSRQATVTIQNTPPVLSGATATPTTIATGESVALRAVAQDADDDSLAATWTLPDGGTLSGLEATTSFSQAGTYTIPVTASDGQATSSSRSVTVTVTAPANGGDSGGDTGGDQGGGDSGGSGDAGGSTGDTGGGYTEDPNGGDAGSDGSAAGSGDSTGDADGNDATADDSTSGDQTAGDAGNDGGQDEAAQTSSQDDVVATDDGQEGQGDQGESEDDLAAERDGAGSLRTQGEGVSWWNRPVPTPAFPALLIGLLAAAVAARRRML